MQPVHPLKLAFSGCLNAVIVILVTIASFTLLFAATPSQAARNLSPIRYSVAYGDSLNGIAERHRISPNAIQFLNSARRLYPVPGTTLILPVEAPPKAPAASALNSFCAHRVLFGESVFSIARLYGIDPYYLAQINWLYDADYIYAGQVLRVPCHPALPPARSCGNATWYVVNPGDNLFRIAIRFGTTVYALAIANHLPNPNLIRSGANLYIPCPGTTAYQALPLSASSPTVLIQTIPSPSPTAVTAVPTQVALPTATSIVPSATRTPSVEVTSSPTVNPIFLATAIPPAQTTSPPTVNPIFLATAIPPAQATSSPTVNPVFLATAIPLTQTVTMVNATFRPAVLTIKAGTTVTWVDQDPGTPHLVLSGSCENGICTPSNLFASNVLSPGDSFTIRFTFVGTYKYYCAFYGAQMTGTINVVP